MRDEKERERPHSPTQDSEELDPGQGKEDMCVYILSSRAEDALVM